MDEEMIIIDGSLHEGGGQMLRTALSLSMITGKPFRMISIRKGRTIPGLKPQHHTIIKTLLDISESRCENYEVGCEEIEFYPGKIIKKEANIDIGTAGSITLVLQALIPIFAFGKRRMVVTVKGGTDVLWSPSIDYLNNVILPYYSIYADIKYSVKKRGYYPKGGGEYEIIIKPKKNDQELQLIDFETPQYIKTIIHSNQERIDQGLCERIDNIISLFLKQLNIPYETIINYSKTENEGCGMTIWCTNASGNDINENQPIVFGVDALLKKKITDLSKEVFEKISFLVKNQIPCDENLADNLMIILACKGGKVRTDKITGHIKSNNLVIEKFLGKDILEENMRFTS